MPKLINFLKPVVNKSNKSISVHEIAQKMQPVNEASLRLPRSFAHSMRNLLETEYDKPIRKQMRKDSESSDPSMSG